MHQNWPAREHVVSTPGNLIHLEVPLGSKDLSFASVQTSRHWRLYSKGSIALIFFLIFSGHLVSWLGTWSCICVAGDRRTEGRTPIASGEIVPGTQSSAAESGCGELVSDQLSV